MYHVLLMGEHRSFSLLAKNNRTRKLPLYLSKFISIAQIKENEHEKKGRRIKYAKFHNILSSYFGISAPIMGVFLS